MPIENHESIIFDRDIPLMFRGTFFGQPIYTPLTGDTSAVNPPIVTDPQATVRLTNDRVNESLLCQLQSR